MAKQSKVTEVSSPQFASFTYHFSPSDAPPPSCPGVQFDIVERVGGATPADVQKDLVNRNSKYAQFLSNCRSLKPSPDLDGPRFANPVIVLTKEEVGLGLGKPPGIPHFPSVPEQNPMAVILGCSDARVPAELLFAQGFDESFVIRVAGNVLGQECVGSIRYALDHYAQNSSKPTDPALQKQTPLKLLVSLGHRDCGAVKAAVSHYLSGLTTEGVRIPDNSIGSIVRRILFPAVSLASDVVPVESFRYFSDCAGLRLAVVTEIAVYLNAAWGASEILKVVEDDNFKIGSDVDVVYGVFDPHDGQVRSEIRERIVTAEAAVDPSKVFARPPATLEELRRLAEKLWGQLDHAMSANLEAVRQHLWLKSV